MEDGMDYLDYQSELFAQHTPYLQWLKGQAKGCQAADAGKRVCTLPFSSCMDLVEGLIGLEQIEEGTLYLFVSKGGRLSPGAEGEIAAVFRENPQAAVVYADEDYLGSLQELYGLEESRFPEETLLDYRNQDTGLYRGKPWFKPEFSPDTLSSFFYMGNVFAVSGAFFKKAWKPQLSLYALAVRVVELVFADAREKIVRLPKVLFTNDSLSAYSELSGFGQLEGKKAEDRAADALASIIIPSKDNSETLGRCLKTLISHTAYPRYELIIVDNGSNEGQKTQIEQMFAEIRSQKEAPEITYLYEKQPFNFSAMCNAGARVAKGEYLLFLNDDIEAVHSDWLDEMLMCASRPHAGAVGAKLLYPKTDSDLHNGHYRIQHAGITNMAIGPAHKLGGMEDKGNLYHGHNLATYNMLAVTAACLMVKQSKFALVGGFDEELAVAYNDVELCFQLYKAGFYNILQNKAWLIHHESLSRGQDTSPERQQRLQNEKRRLYAKHSDLKGKDPFYSPNLVQWKRDVAYNSSYLFACDKPVTPRLLTDREVRLLPRSHHNKYIKKLTGENRSMLTIDSIEQSADTDAAESFLVINGWYVMQNQDNAQVERALLLRSAGQSVSHERLVYKLEIHPKLRDDVAALFAGTDTENTALSGIQAAIDKASLPAGQYEIGMLAKKGRGFAVWSGVCFGID